MSDASGDGASTGAMRQVAALYVELGGAYYGLPHVDPWDKARDARLYAGPHPVVAHPPCNLWVNFAAVNWKRYGRQLPAWYPGGSDGGCFEHALTAVRDHGGVLEHPAFSHAWAHFGLSKPVGIGWQRCVNGGWVCEVWQSAYGHLANKATWLYYFGDVAPLEMRWNRPVGQFQIGFQDQRGKAANKPTVSKRIASATPPAFRDVLIRLAGRS